MNGERRRTVTRHPSWIRHFANPFRWLSSTYADGFAAYYRHLTYHAYLVFIPVGTGRYDPVGDSYYLLLHHFHPVPPHHPPRQTGGGRRITASQGGG